MYRFWRPANSKRASAEGVDRIRLKPPTRDHRSRPATVRRVDDPVASSSAPPMANRAGTAAARRTPNGSLKMIQAAAAPPASTTRAPTLAQPLEINRPCCRAQALMSPLKPAISVLSLLPAATLDRWAQNVPPGPPTRRPMRVVTGSRPCQPSGPLASVMAQASGAWVRVTAPCSAASITEATKAFAPTSSWRM